MEIKNKLAVTRGRWGGITGERKGRVKSRNMDKGPTEKDSRVGRRIECGQWRVGRAGKGNGGKWGQL